ncbi:MAG TPA: aminotransferase class I/II-fold pyridoxal phosphate-dependent enzyme [Candidatus Binataceae bacterium]|nr:aminotransferase class I/II-fold pyridoxal phosphate-dependent enzyme [Candidatus Binataceae bacterium]
MKLEIDRTHGGGAPPGALDFSASLNPLGPPPQALAAYHDAAALIARYPPPYPGDLAARLAQRHRVAPDNVVVGNGSTQLIHLLARTLRPRRPFVAIPTFSEIANAMIVAGVAPCAIPASRERGFAIEIEQVGRALEQGADAIFIGRPNSPTGAMLSIGDAAEIAARCSSRGCWCVFDEAFIDFAGEEHSAIRLAAEDSRVIVLRSLTKMFAIPGLRLGYLVAGREAARHLREAIEPWSVNVVAERVGNACLDVAEDYAARSRILVVAERAHLGYALASIEGIHSFASCANFLMLEVARDGRSGSFARHMFAHGIAVRDLRGLPGCGPGLYRVAVRLREENEQLIAAARAYFD